MSLGSLSPKPRCRRCHPMQREMDHLQAHALSPSFGLSGDSDQATGQSTWSTAGRPHSLILPPFSLMGRNLKHPCQVRQNVPQPAIGPNTVFPLFCAGEAVRADLVTLASRALPRVAEASCESSRRIEGDQLSSVVSCSKKRPPGSQPRRKKTQRPDLRGVSEPRDPAHVLSLSLWISEARHRLHTQCGIKKDKLQEMTTDEA